MSSTYDRFSYLQWSVEFNMPVNLIWNIYYEIEWKNTMKNCVIKFRFVFIYIVSSYKNIFTFIYRKKLFTEYKLQRPNNEVTTHRQQTKTCLI